MAFADNSNRLVIDLSPNAQRKNKLFSEAVLMGEYRQTKQNPKRYIETKSFTIRHLDGQKRSIDDIGEEIDRLKVTDGLSTIQLLDKFSSKFKIVYNTCDHMQQALETWSEAYNKHQTQFIPIEPENPEGANSFKLDAVPPEFPILMTQHHLRKYVKEPKVTRDTHTLKNGSQIYNGTLTVKHKGIIRGIRGKMWLGETFGYPSGFNQTPMEDWTPFCNKCLENTHITIECTNDVKCSRCRQVGHKMDQCTKCQLCTQWGHSTNTCAQYKLLMEQNKSSELHESAIDNDLSEELESLAIGDKINVQASAHDQTLNTNDEAQDSNKNQDDCDNISVSEYDNMSLEKLESLITDFNDKESEIRKGGVSKGKKKRLKSLGKTRKRILEIIQEKKEERFRASTPMEGNKGEIDKEITSFERSTGERTSVKERAKMFEEKETPKTPNDTSILGKLQKAVRKSIKRSKPESSVEKKEDKKARSNSELSTPIT